MNLRLLLTPALQPVPGNISVIQNWGLTTIVIENDIFKRETGDHVIVQGEPADLKNWIDNNGGAFLGIGHPQMEQFGFANSLNIDPE